MVIASADLRMKWSVLSVYGLTLSRSAAVVALRPFQLQQQRLIGASLGAQLRLICRDETIDDGSDVLVGVIWARALRWRYTNGIRDSTAEDKQQQANAANRPTSRPRRKGDRANKRETPHHGASGRPASFTAWPGELGPARVRAVRWCRRMAQPVPPMKGPTFSDGCGVSPRRYGTRGQHA